MNLCPIVTGTVTTATSNGSYLSCLLTSKQVSVMVQRALVKDDNASVEWIDFLKILDRLCNGVIVATHVCQASFDYVCKQIDVYRHSLSLF